MRNRARVYLFVTSLLSVLPTAFAQSPSAHGSVRLSPALFELLRAEMREITGGVQMLAPALAMADWNTVASVSERIRASYIMEKKLTPTQREELERALPEPFKALDADFHMRAQKLGAAATARDPEQAAFQYYRLVETCTACHAAYASSRFPGFAQPKPAPHGH